MLKRRKIFSRFTTGESGQALILVLVFILLGSLTIIPTLEYMTTALKSGVSYEEKSKEFFTADAGIENGLWRVKYDFMGPEYDPYDFDTTWIYETDPLNNLTAEVSVQNVWIPSNVTLDSLNLSSAEARAIIESEKLVITGTSGHVPGEPYRIKIDFTPVEGDNLTIKSIGIWLPQGFEYTDDCALSDDPFAEYYPDYVNETVVPGGSTIVWGYYADYPLFTSFPNLQTEEGTMTIDFTFTYDPPAADPEKMPVAIAWVLTDMDPSCPNPNDVPIAWDTDTRIYKITSTAGDINIEAYSAKLELRNLNNAIAGDYAAIGNSLMTNPVNHIYTTLLSSKDSTLTTNPADADVITAYLYWSGFRQDYIMFSDTCNSGNFSSSWLDGGDWAYYDSYPNYYRGQHSGADSNRYLTLVNGLDLGAYPTGTTFELSWRQSVSSLSAIFADTCTNSNFSNWWVNGGDWDYESSGGKKYKAQHSGGDDATRYLTMKNSQDLDGYSAVTLSWDQRKNGTLDSGDYLYFSLSSDGGETWSSNITAGSSANLTDYYITYNYVVPTEYCTSSFKIRFYIAGFGSGKYCYIDNIYITPIYSALDGLDFALSANGGTSWSSNIQAFRENIGTSWSTFTYSLTGQYLTSSDFKLRFYLVGMGGNQQYVNIDNIQIIARSPDTSITFSINDEQVYLDAQGDPQSGAQPLTASSGSIIVNESWGGYSYACSRDVSKLVKKYPVVPEEEHHTGNAKYTVGDVQADTGEHVSYAGWSLIIIYSSPETAGHYLYLYDVFSFNPQYTNLDFDYDGQPGGDITGFRFPEPIRDKYGMIVETVAARLTAFVGEGDDWLHGSVPNTDCARVIGQQSQNSKYLSNTDSPYYNIWNSDSYPVTSAPGVDIDTFEILWDDNILTPNDTRLHLDMYSGQDAWNLIYFILSVRSETVTRGTDYYIIGSL